LTVPAFAKSPVSRSPAFTRLSPQPHRAGDCRDDQHAYLLFVRTPVPGAAERRAGATVLPAILSASVSCRRAILDAQCHRQRHLDHHRHQERASRNTRVASRGGRGDAVEERDHGAVTLTWSPRDRKLVNQWAMDHTTTLAGATPILALDMYEHSYHMDYGARAAVYVDAFMAAINWPNVARAYSELRS
jgi:hypothetical protein